MEALNTKNQEQINRWLKYWAVYGVLQVFEGFADHSLGFLPLFHFIKVCPFGWQLLSFNLDCTFLGTVCVVDALSH